METILPLVAVIAHDLGRRLHRRRRRRCHPLRRHRAVERRGRYALVDSAIIIK